MIDVKQFIDSLVSVIAQAVAQVTVGCDLDDILIALRRVQNIAGSAAGLIMSIKGQSPAQLCGYSPGVPSEMEISPQGSPDAGMGLAAQAIRDMVAGINAPKEPSFSELTQAAEIADRMGDKESAAAILEQIKRRIEPQKAVAGTIDVPSDGEAVMP